MLDVLFLHDSLRNCFSGYSTSLANFLCMMLDMLHMLDALDIIDITDILDILGGFDVLFLHDA